MQARCSRRAVRQAHGRQVPSQRVGLLSSRPVELLARRIDDAVYAQRCRPLTAARYPLDIDSTVVRRPQRLQAAGMPCDPSCGEPFVETLG